MLTYVVGPFEFDGNVRVAGVISFDTFDNCQGGDVLEKADGGLLQEGDGVADDSGEDETAGWRYPDVVASTSTCHLDCCCGC